MRLSTWSRVSLTCVASCTLVGCGGVDVIALKTWKLMSSRTRRANARVAGRKPPRSGTARGEAGELETRRVELEKQVSDLSTSLRFANEQATSAAAQRDNLRVKVSEIEKTSERLQQSLDKVKSVASASVGELADLRLKQQEMEERLQKSTEAKNALARRTRTVPRAGTDPGELVRTRPWCGRCEKVEPPGSTAE